MANFWLGSATPPSAWTSETAYSGTRNYQNNQMGITTSAMTQLRARLNFIQMRFHCSKEQGRTFHVITAANSTGEAVVQYFSGQSDTLPASCGSFVMMEDDNSELAKKCSKWGNDPITLENGVITEKRMNSGCTITPRLLQTCITG